MKALSYDNCLIEFYRLNSQQQSTALFYFIRNLDGLSHEYGGGLSHAQITEAFNRARIKAVVVVPFEGTAARVNL